MNAKVQLFFRSKMGKLYALILVTSLLIPLIFAAQLGLGLVLTWQLINLAGYLILGGLIFRHMKSPLSGHKGSTDLFTFLDQVETEKEELMSELKVRERTLFDVSRLQDKFLKNLDRYDILKDIAESCLNYFQSETAHFYKIEERANGLFAFEQLYRLESAASEKGQQESEKFISESLENIYGITLDSQVSRFRGGLEGAIFADYLGIFLYSNSKVIGCIGIKVKDFASLSLSEGQLSVIRPYIDMTGILVQAILNHHQVNFLMSQYEQAQSAAKIGSWHMLLDGNQLTWSREMFELFGIESRTGIPSLEERRQMIHPEDLGAWEQAINALVLQGTSYQLSFRLLREGGEEVWIQTNARPLIDENGKVIGAFGTSQDVSESMKLSREIMHKEDTLSTIMSYVPISILTFDVEGECGYVNDEWERLTNRPIHEALGQGWRSSIFIADSAKISAIMEEIKEHPSSLYPFDLRLLNESKQEIKWVSGKIVRMFDEEKRHIGFLVTLLDVTEMKRHEEQGKEALNRLELALYSGELGLWDWNLKDNEISFDERWCAMLGYKTSEVESSVDGFRKLIHPGDHELAFKRIDDYLSGKISNYEVIYRMKHKQGEWVPILSKGKVTSRAQDSTPIRFIGTHLDFTRQHEIENELREAKNRAEDMSQVKSIFLANMSHEIRSPLNGIVGMTELLQDQVETEEGKQYLQTLLSCSETLLHIIGDILDYSKMEADRFELSVTPNHLKEIARETYLSFEGERRKRELAFNFIWDEGLSSFYYFDALRLRQILFNLLSNAFKFTSSGEVSLEIKKGEKGEVLIIVSDSGIGIEKEKQHLLFERFSQIDSGMTKQVEGTGLGLVIVKNLVSMMSGALHFESTSGKGTRFKISLPLEALAADYSPDEQDEESEHLFKSMKILVAEDNEINQTLMKKLLERLGHQVVVAANGAEVLEYYRSGNFVDLILMDLHMPKMDGLSAMSALKSEFEEVPPVIAVSANSFDEDKEACLAAGMIDFLAKPVKKGHLERLLRNFSGPL